MRACPPCDYKCQGGKDCPSRGGTYFAEYAEDNFQHVHAPAPVAVVKPYTAPQDDEPLSFCAKACWAGAAFFVAIILAAGLVDWLMSLPLN
jgi:hypothetical protein